MVVLEYKQVFVKLKSCASLIFDIVIGKVGQTKPKFFVLQTSFVCMNKCARTQQYANR